MKPGKSNDITDIDGVVVGQATDESYKTGVTVFKADAPFVASVDVMGGAPGTRETDLLAPENTVEAVDAFVLSGGSAYGLDAASAVSQAIAESGGGYQVGSVTVPIVPAAIIFDLLSGGMAGTPPEDGLYRRLGRAAFQACSKNLQLGSVGAGAGATTANLKGGTGSASLVLEEGYTVAALIVANPFGSVVAPETGQFWAAPMEQYSELGDAGVVQGSGAFTHPPTKRLTANARANTTIGVIATDAVLTKAQAKRLAVAAQDGLARAIVPSHTPFDGDLLFSMSTARHPLREPATDLCRLGHAAAVCVARAVARGIYEATPKAKDVLPTWREKWG